MAKRVLQANDRGGYTVPSPKLYPHQWAWDSAFAAIGWAHIDRDRAVLELETLMKGQWPDGRIPHILFHDLQGRYFPGPEFWRTRNSSSISQPPVWASAARRLWQLGCDQQRIRRLLPAFEASHEFFWKQRDPLGWRLVAVTHPWESGMDNSPIWDRPLQAVDPSQAPAFQRVDTEIVGDSSQRPSDDEYRRYAVLVQQIADNHFGLSQFQVYDPGMSALLVRAEEDLAWLAEQTGFSTQAGARAQSCRQALMEKLWSPTRGHFCFYDAAAGEALELEVLASYLPLILELPIGDPLQQQLAQNFAATYGWPTVPLTSPHYRPVLYWRGPCWINMNWLLAPWSPAGFRTQSLQMIEREGFYEYFDARTGKGLGGSDFTWSAALVLDWLAEINLE